MNRFTKVLAGLGLMVALLAPATTHAQTTLTPDTWFTFTWTGLGDIADPADGYFFSTTSAVYLQVTDRLIVGDMFEIFINNASVGTTSSVDPNTPGSTNISDPDAAWADSRLSKRSWLLGPGDYYVDISVTQVTYQTSAGGAYIRQTVTPEPATLLLLGTGLLGIGAVGIRRRRGGFTAGE